MRVRILRNVGTMTARDLATAGMTLPDGLVEGQDVDLSNNVAQALITLRIAETIQGNAARPTAQTDKPTPAQTQTEKPKA